MNKKLIALVLCAVMVLSMMPVNTASAAGNFTISVTDATANLGKELKVDLVLENNPGFSALVLTVSYDNTYLTLNKVENKASGMEMTSGKNILWDSDKDYTKNGTIATLTFTVKETTPTNAPQTIQVKFREAINVAGDALTAQTKNGTITVKCEHKEEVVKGKDATCTENGLTDGKKCTICDTVTVKQEVIPAGHKWVAASCTAPKTCSACKTTEGTKLGHNYSNVWSKDETNHYHACSRCDSKVDTAAHTYKNDKDEDCEICGYNRGHIHNLSKVGAVAATCTESGNKEYYACSGCDVLFEDAAGKTEITNVVIPATGHAYEDATWTWDGTTAASVTVACSVCKNSANAKATVTSKEDPAATCTKDGVMTYTATATVGGKTFTSTKTETTKATGHNFKNGKCTVCETADPDYVAPTDPTEPPVTEPPVTEPPVTEPPVTEPPVTEPPHTHSYSAKVTKPTCTTKGYTTYTCSCGDSFIADEVAATGHTFGAWTTVKDPTSKEVGKEERVCACGVKETRDIPKLTNKFADVKATDYYYEPVLWAVNKGITAGTDKDAFGPSNPCTRAQVVTFLWRAAGSPEPKSTVNPFTDVKTTDYYYKAVLWARENNITSGVSETKFGSGAVCTRAQVVTFLWRAAGSPAAKATTINFTDVKTTDYFYNAVLWAVENGITAGTSATTFGSSNNCVRGQIVTFLYKAYAK